MNINRNNYEEFFLLYADNELSASGKQAVENFAAAHPDLRAELDMLQQAVLPNEFQAVFLDKETLFRTSDTNSLVNMTNYEDYFVKYADDELSNAEKAATEEFVYKYPECQAEFELIQQARLHPDTSILFPDKNLLYRKTAKEKPVILLWMRFAAAAALIIIAGLFWLRQGKQEPMPNTQAGLVKKEQPVPVSNEPIRPVKPVEINQGNPLALKSPAANHTVQPKKQGTPSMQKENSRVPEELATHDIPPAKTQIDDKKTIDPAALAVLANTNTPDILVKQTDAIETHKLPEPVYASNTASEDFIYVDNTPARVKSPLRGLLRKASRYVEQKNPLSSEHKKGGVFTASQEQ